MKDWDYKKTWYHGTPLVLEKLRKGSTITQDINLARIFSHKPSIVSKDDGGKVMHNGNLNGYIYQIDESISEEDITPHPNTTMEPGEEWLTRRVLQLKMISITEPTPSELLTEQDIELLKRKI